MSRLLYTRVLNLTVTSEVLEWWWRIDRRLSSLLDGSNSATWSNLLSSISDPILGCIRTCLPCRIRSEYLFYLLHSLYVLFWPELTPWHSCYAWKRAPVRLKVVVVFVFFKQRCVNYDMPRLFAFDLVRETDQEFEARVGWVYSATSPIQLPAMIHVLPHQWSVISDLATISPSARPYIQVFELSTNDSFQNFNSYAKCSILILFLSDCWFSARILLIVFDTVKLVILIKIMQIPKILALLICYD